MVKEIVYFLPDVDAGVTSIVRNLLKFRPKSDIYYKVILTRQLEREAVIIKDQFNVDEQIVFTYSKFENLYAVCKRLKIYISSENSIIVSNDGLELRMVQLLKMPNPLVYIIHGDFKYYYGLVHNNAGIIDQYIAYSEYTKKQLYQLVNPTNNIIKLLYYPVPEKETISKIDKTTDLLFVGSFTERKGVQYLHQIFNSIKNMLSNVNFVLVGSGEMEGQLKAQFSSEPNVVFKGQLKNDDVIKEMQNAKVLLFPSLSEGLPNVVVEAMKAKCIPVCSDIPSGIPDLIEDGITGFRVPIGDVEEFSKSALSLLKDEEKRNIMASNGFKKASIMFQPQQNAEYYEQLILDTQRTKKRYCQKTVGGILNQPHLPNNLVKFVRKLKISSKL